MSTFKIKPQVIKVALNKLILTLSISPLIFIIIVFYTNSASNLDLINNAYLITIGSVFLLVLVFAYNRYLTMKRYLETYKIDIDDKGIEFSAYGKNPVYISNLTIESIHEFTNKQLVIKGVQKNEIIIINPNIENREILIEKLISFQSIQKSNTKPLNKQTQIIGSLIFIALFITHSYTGHQLIKAIAASLICVYLIWHLRAINLGKLGIVISDRQKWIFYFMIVIFGISTLVNLFSYLGFIPTLL